MKIPSTYVLVPVALLAVLILAGCDQQRGNDASSAAETANAATADVSEDPSVAAAQDRTSADAYATATAPAAGGASTTNPMGDTHGDAPMASDPSQAATVSGSETTQRAHDQHALRNGQDGTYSGDEARDDSGSKLTP